MILEVRDAENNVSINHGGRSQGRVTGLEVHVKDASRFPAELGFLECEIQRRRNPDPTDRNLL